MGQFLDIYCIYWESFQECKNIALVSREWHQAVTRAEAIYYPRKCPFWGSYVRNQPPAARMRPRDHATPLGQALRGHNWNQYRMLDIVNLVSTCKAYVATPLGSLVRQLGAGMQTHVIDPFNMLFMLRVETSAELNAQYWIGAKLDYRTAPPQQWINISKVKTILVPIDLILLRLCFGQGSYRLLVSWFSSHLICKETESVRYSFDDFKKILERVAQTNKHTHDQLMNYSLDNNFRNLIHPDVRKMWVEYKTQLTTR